VSTRRYQTVLGGKAVGTESLRASGTADVSSPPKRNLKTAALDEAKSFVGIFIYMFIVFGLLSLHAWVVLSAENISYRFYGMALINALVLSKIILLAEGFKFADKFKNQPLVYPVAYKAIAFTALLFAAYVVEEVLVGLWHGKSLAESFPVIGGGTIGEWLAAALIMCIALVPFFAFREMTRAIGRPQFFALCFTGRLKAR
jgi:hypothetical protein